MNTRSSNHAEFLNWYEAIHPAFVRYCRSRAYGRMETEDLVQEAVLATLEAFYRIERKEKLLSFMIGVANNILNNQRRRQQFRAAWEDKVLERMESQIGDPELALDIHFLHRAIDQLPERQKEALLLFEIAGFSIRELAQIQESSEAAVKTRLSRARKALQGLLDERDEKSKALPLSKRLAIYAALF
ncbi:MAG: RNA polymerase sigma factor [Bacteroidota bacterium]